MPDSAEYRRIVGETDYYEGLHIVARHLVDAWVQAGHSRDDGVTWYDDRDNSRGVGRLDYGFVSAGLATKVSRAWIDDEALGSNHQPAWFELSI